MKIAIYHNLPSGGAKRTLWQFMKLLSEAGHILDVYTLSPSDGEFLTVDSFAEQTYKYHYRVHQLHHSGEPIVSNFVNLRRQRKNFAELDRVCRTIASQINQGRYDLAFVHPCRFSQSPAVLKYFTIPSVYLCQEPPRFFYEPTVSYEALTQPSSSRTSSVRPLLLRKISGFLYAKRKNQFKTQDITNGQHATCMLANSYYSKESLYRVYGKFPLVQYLGVDPEIFRPLPNIPKTHTVLCVGRFAPLKQHHFVIKSISRIPEQIRPSIVIIGDSSHADYKAYLVQLAEMLQVSLTLVERISDQELVTWYNRASVLAYPPILEPLGLVVLEAMSCALPVVGVREGGIRETIVHEQTGLLVERDEQAFAEALMRVLQSSELRESFGTAGRTHILQHWTWKQSSERLLNIFQTLAPSD